MILHSNWPAAAAAAAAPRRLARFVSSRLVSSRPSTNFNPQSRRRYH